MKKILTTTIAFFAILNLVFSQTTQWNVDEPHSEIVFKTKHMLVSTVSGEFTQFDISFVSDKEDFTDAKIQFSAKVASISTGMEKRDNHLQSEDFFNAEKNPEVIFKGKALEKIEGNKYQLSGELTMGEVTKPVTFDVEYGGTVKGPWGNTRAGFAITGSVNRFEYGLKWDAALETGGFVVSEEVKIECNIELIKAQ